MRCWPPTDASSDNGRWFRSAARKGDARAPQDTSPSEALASKQRHMAMRKWLTLAAALVVAGATARDNDTAARTELASTGKLRVGLLVGSLSSSSMVGQQMAVSFG